MPEASLDVLNRLSDISEPLTWNEEKSELMLEACRVSAQYHYENNKSIRFLYDRMGFKPSDLQKESDFGKLPALSVYAMKHHLLLSMEESKAVLKMTSSGTSGQKTWAWMDQESLDRGQKMLRSLWNQEGLISAAETNYMLFVYNQSQAKDLGVAFSAKNRTQFAPPHRIEYAINQNPSGDWEFQKSKVLENLLQFIEEKKPVRVLGITGFIYEFIQELKDKKTRLELPKGSFLFTTGGWKAAEAKKVDRSVFQKEASEYFGIQLQNIRDGYGMAEHGAPYWQCKDHHFHVPAYARILSLDPVTLTEKEPGEPGLLKLITPFNRMMPNLAILSTDLGRLITEPCSCGWNSPRFEILGRAGLSKNKGCAIQADEIVKRVKS